MLSARRDNDLAGRAGCALSAQISDLSFFRVSHPLNELDVSLSGWVSLSLSSSLSESSTTFTFSSNYNFVLASSFTLIYVSVPLHSQYHLFSLFN